VAAQPGHGQGNVRRTGMNTLAKALTKADGILTLILKIITITLLVVLTLIITANILLRIFPFTSLHWSDEIVEMCFAALVFYGAAGVWMVKGHFSVGDWIRKVVKNERARSAYRLLLELISLAFACILVYYSMNLVIRAREVTAVFQIPKKVLYSCMPVSGLIMIAYSIVYVIRAAIGIVNPGSPAALVTATKPEDAPAAAPKKPPKAARIE
jgi:TRAP-type C4-dicarboxylate transport system permease small subunit